MFLFCKMETARLAHAGRALILKTRNFSRSSVPTMSPIDYYYSLGLEWTVMMMTILIARSY